MYNLRKLRIELEASIQGEQRLREHWMKCKPDDLDNRLKQSLSYQLFLERMINEVLDEAII